MEFKFAILKGGCTYSAYFLWIFTNFQLVNLQEHFPDFPEFIENFDKINVKFTKFLQKWATATLNKNKISTQGLLAWSSVAADMTAVRDSEIGLFSDFMDVLEHWTLHKNFS